MSTDTLQLFVLDASRPFGERVAQGLGVAVAAHLEREFGGGENKTRALESVRGNDVYVLHSLYAENGISVNDKLCRLLFFVGALKDAAAARITAVIPYLAYTRKDSKTNPRDPLTLRYVAAMFEAVGTSSVLTLEVHNVAAFQNAFRCVTEHLDTCALFANHFTPLVAGTETVVVSPDTGGSKRAKLFRSCLENRVGNPVNTALCEKYRKGGQLSGTLLVGDVRDKTAILFDDMVDSGQTLARAAATCREHGAARVFAAASHGLFGSGSADTLNAAGIDAVVVSDSVLPAHRTDGLPARLSIVSTAGLFAQAITRMHEGGSVSALCAW